MSASYRCRACKALVPRGHRMQYCQCGSIWVDWGAGGKSSCIRVGWPHGNPEDWVETILEKDDGIRSDHDPGEDR